MEKYPLIDMTIDEEHETGVEFISFVDQPAIEREWMAFNKTKRLEFKPTDEEKRIVSGAIMVANLPIYRRDQQGEYYVKFSSGAIQKIVERFFKNGLTSRVNLDHDKAVDGVYSWFGSFKVDNDDVWKQVKDGTFRGFSIEGMFTDSASKDLDKELIDKIVKVLSES